MTTHGRSVNFGAVERRNVIIGIAVLILIVLGIVWFRNRAVDQKVTSLPTPSSAAKALESKFNVTLPEKGTKIDLKVVNGEGIGAASRNFENGTFSQTVLADLPESGNNEYYEVWVIKGKEGDSDYSQISLGRLVNQKGGFILDYESPKDYSDHKRLVVTKETKNDGKMETVVLDGNY